MQCTQHNINLVPGKDFQNILYQSIHCKFGNTALTAHILTYTVCTNRKLKSNIQILESCGVYLQFSILKTKSVFCHVTIINILHIFKANSYNPFCYF